MFILLRSIKYDSMIDVGAYFGYFSIYLDLVQQAEVIAYEADIDNFKQLQFFISYNNSKVKAFNNAVGDVVDEINFFKPTCQESGKFPSHGQIGDPSKDSNNLYKNLKYTKQSVKMLPLKDIIELHLKGKTLLKIDIEGYEEKALRSAQNLLKQLKDIDLIVEIMINDTNSLEVFNLLQDCGYKGYLITNAGLVAEDRPLVLPKPNADPHENKLRTLWKNHFFTKRSSQEIKKLNLNIYKYNI